LSVPIRAGAKHPAECHVPLDGRRQTWIFIEEFRFRGVHQRAPAGVEVLRESVAYDVFQGFAGSPDLLQPPNGIASRLKSNQL